MGYLVDYARKHNLEAEPGFTPKTVRFALDFAADGRFLGVLELGDPDDKKNKGQVFAKCPDLSQPEFKRAGVGSSHFLVDSAAVVALLGVADDDAKTPPKHAYFTRLLSEASSAEPCLGPCAESLLDPQVVHEARRLLAERRAKPSDSVTVRCGGRFVVNLDSWHDWWRARRAGLQPKPERGAKLMRCFATGGLVEPLATHWKVRGLADVGGLSMGSTFVGFKQPAFASYGLEQSANCAMSTEAAAAYRAALEELLDRHSERLIGAKVAHWFKESVRPEDDLLPWLFSPPGQEDPREEADAQHLARQLLNDIRAGTRTDLAANHYYALTVSDAGGRGMVRDWMEGPFEQLVERVAQWFGDLAIVHRDGDRQAPAPKFMAVVGAMARELSDVPPPLVTRLWRAAVAGEAIPPAALSMALERVRVAMAEDDPPNHARMGLIRAYHIRKARQRGDTEMATILSPGLNESHPSPAYQCGRLMAVLARLQHAALGDVGAGVVQRYYAAASCTPSLVLGRLTRQSQFHLNKLEGGLAHWFEGLLGGIYSGLGDSIPRVLDLEGQSLFALGYYKQLAALRARRTQEPDSAEAADDMEGEIRNG